MGQQEVKSTILLWQQEVKSTILLWQQEVKDISTHADLSSNIFYILLVLFKKSVMYNINTNQNLICGTIISTETETILKV